MLNHKVISPFPTLLILLLMKLCFMHEETPQMQCQIFWREDFKSNIKLWFLTAAKLKLIYSKARGNVVKLAKRKCKNKHIYINKYKKHIGACPPFQTSSSFTVSRFLFCQDIRGLCGLRCMFYPGPSIAMPCCLSDKHSRCWHYQMLSACRPPVLLPCYGP